MSTVVIDLPALAGEYEALCDTAVPLVRERFRAAREALDMVLARGERVDGLLSKIEAAVELAEPGSDFDFIVRDLLALQRELLTVQIHVTSASQLFVRTNISLTAAATIAACEGREST